MKNYPISDKTYVKKSRIPNSGRGVFAKCDIKCDEIIEKSPIIEIPQNETQNLNESILINYFFYFGKNKNRQAIALGFGSFYNHLKNPNAKYIIKDKEASIDFIAIKDIKKDDEITINYSNGNNKDERPLWFEA